MNGRRFGPEIQELDRNQLVPVRNPGDIVARGEGGVAVERGLDAQVGQGHRVALLRHPDKCTSSVNVGYFRLLLSRSRTRDSFKCWGHRRWLFPGMLLVQYQLRRVSVNLARTSNMNHYRYDQDNKHTY